MNSENYSKFANLKVLDFYKELPFNYYSDPQKQMDSVKNGKANIKANGPLEKEIIKANTILDVGCGPGWLSNSISYLYKDKKVTALDFNPVAVERASEVAKNMNLDTNFIVDDLFNFKPSDKFDLVMSIGVLMCTNDCLEAIRSLIRNTLKPGGSLYIGLYHKYGRPPFLNHFKKLSDEGKSENELLEEYSQIHSEIKDKTHIKSWFRDQVLHPHETLHTIEEMIPLLDAEGLKMTHTSVNRFEPINFKNDNYDEDQLRNIFDLEKKMENDSKKALDDRRYYPGFFTFLAK